MQKYNMKKEDVSKTYIVNIRVDIRHMARIALFYASQNKYLNTSSKMASAVIQNAGESLKKTFSVDTFSEAARILQSHGYDDCLAERAKHHRSLFKQLALESSSEAEQEKINKIAVDLEKTFKNTTQVSKPTEEQAAFVLAMNDNKSSKKTLTPAEAEELKKKDKKALAELKTGLKGV